MLTIRLLPICAILYLLLFATTTRGQAPESTSLSTKDPSSLSVKLAVQYGQMLRLKGKLLGEPNAEGQRFKNAWLWTMEIGVKSTGEKLWEQIANYPIRGIGWSKVRFSKRDELGSPWALYGFYRSHILRKKRYSWNYKLAVGISSGWKQYDPVTNPNNDVIGSKFNAYVEINTGASLKLSRSFFLDGDVGLTHFSNGSSKLPQKGINILAYSLGLRYTPARPKGKMDPATIVPFKTRHEIYVYLGSGLRQVDFNRGSIVKGTETYDLNYLMSNLTIGYQIQRKYQFKWGGGLDINYDGTANSQVKVNGNGVEKAYVPVFHKIGLSAFTGFEWSEGPFSLIFHVGYDIYRKKFDYNYAPFYQRLGFRYYFTPELFAGLNIRSVHFRIAKYMEWNIGFKKTLFEEE